MGTVDHPKHKGVARNDGGMKKIIIGVGNDQFSRCMYYGVSMRFRVPRCPYIRHAERHFTDSIWVPLRILCIGFGSPSIFDEIFVG